jgi:hypothetical protein
MILLTDNDIILKLGACDLLEVFPLACGVSRDDVQVLETAEHYIRNILNKSGKHQEKIEQYSEAGLRRALDFVKSARHVGAHDSRVARVLTGIEAMDVGETILYAAAYGMTDTIVTTGDKRALRSLAGTGSARQIVQRLQARVLCFEQVILRCMEHIGFPELRHRIIATITCDTALRSVFGGGMLTQESDVRKTLTDYIEDLRAGTCGLLMSDQQTTR